MRGNAAAAVAVLALAGFTGVAPPLAAQQQCAAPADKVSEARGWALQRLAPDRVWGLTRGDSVQVAVVGTGVSAASPALAGAVAPGADLTGGGAADDDCSGRDTFVAGVIAARQLPGTGFTGVAPGARIFPVRVTNDPSKVDPGKLAAGIRLAADSGARVIAISVGTPAATPDLRAAVAYAGSRDVLVVAASDVDVGKGAVPYPAGFPESLPVAGVGENGTAAGSAARPALVAPGSQVVSIAPRGAGNVTATGGGIAVGFVAGAAALVRDYRPGLTAVQVRYRLETTADHPSAVLPDPQRGFGVVNPHAAVTTVLPAESGDRAMPAQTPPLRLPPVRAGDPLPVTVALVVTGVVGGAALLGGIAAALAQRARRRGWRSAWAPSEEGER
ncbi:type VII secretion-associated serine protease mycosin [Saccharopolyspora shandongensis]|uniref:Type VII secretion-associated serine protease mycosin n=1 Tax=Saccharopolyspora shandongensis TaxID=418495 RepID=A0A1H3MT91_9PSEU|nr:S8 family serine peptidase [Saccharopolyspora shandongensis]SDY79901.1 type VII secretion-associated serine protease mycosin [Saccharopolyspora shandongensis]